MKTRGRNKLVPKTSLSYIRTLATFRAYFSSSCPWRGSTSSTVRFLMKLLMMTKLFSCSRPASIFWDWSCYFSGWTVCSSTMIPIWWLLWIDRRLTERNRAFSSPLKIIFPQFEEDRGGSFLHTWVCRTRGDRGRRGFYSGKIKLFLLVGVFSRLQIYRPHYYFLFGFVVHENKKRQIWCFFDREKNMLTRRMIFLMKSKCDTEPRNRKKTLFVKN